MDRSNDWRQKVSGVKTPCIFLVDDDIATLESFTMVLENEGYTVLTATNGLELKALLLDLVPDLILMDFNLGEDNGGMLTGELKQNSQTASIPVIIISANAQAPTTASLMGANDFIEKPIEIPVLLSKIEEHISAVEIDGI